MAGLSKRGAFNLLPNPMFDLQRELEEFPAYDPRRNPEGVIDISSAKNELLVGEVQQMVKKYKLSPHTTQYGSTAGSIELRTCLARYTNEFFAPRIPIQTDNLMVTNGVSSLLSILTYSLCDANEGVMLATPNYGMFQCDLVSQTSANLITVPTDDMEDRFIADGAMELLDRFQTAFDAALDRGCCPRILLLSNPCNPLGRCYSRTTLVRLAQFCNQHNMHLVSDEIYALSGFHIPEGLYNNHGNPMDGFTSVLTLVGDNIHALSGASKDFGCGGLRLGWLITRNSLVWQAVRRLATTTWITRFSDEFFTHLLSDVTQVRKVIETYRTRLESHHRLTTTFLRAHHVPFANGNAGCFLFLDLRPWLYYVPADADREASPEMRLCRHLLRHGVFLQPGEAFFATKPGQYRLVYSGNDDKTLRLGLSRLVSVLADLANGLETEKGSLEPGARGKIVAFPDLGKRGRLCFPKDRWWCTRAWGRRGELNCFK